jgi:hypothetical protein
MGAALPIAIQIISLVVMYGPDAVEAVKSLYETLSSLMSSDAVTQEQWDALDAQVNAVHEEIQARVAAKLAEG